jgi:hypothetical protein
LVKKFGGTLGCVSPPKLCLGIKMAATDHLYSEFISLYDYSFFDIYTKDNTHYIVKKEPPFYTLCWEHEMKIIHSFSDLIEVTDIRNNTNIIRSHNYLEDFDFGNAVVAASQKLKQNRLDTVTVYTRTMFETLTEVQEIIHLGKTEFGFVVTSEKGRMNVEIDSVEDFIKLVPGVPQIVHTSLYF